MMMKQQNKNKSHWFKLFEWVSFKYYNIDLLIVMFIVRAGNYLIYLIWIVGADSVTMITGIPRKAVQL